MTPEISRTVTHNGSDQLENAPLITWFSREEQARIPTHLDLTGVLRAGRNKLKKSGEINGRPLAIYENKYVISTGQVTVPVVRTVYLTRASESWPKLTVSPRKFLSRLILKLGYVRGIQLDDATFNAAFRVKTDNEDFAITLLTPDIQSFLLTKRSVTWKIDQGRLALIYNGAFKEKKLDASLQRLHSFLQLIPPELDAWGM